MPPMSPVSVLCGVVIRFSHQNALGPLLLLFLTWINLPSGRYHCLMLSGDAEANVFSFGCAHSARMLFLWLVSVQMLRPAARSQSRTVLSCDPETTLYVVEEHGMMAVVVAADGRTGGQGSKLLRDC